MCSHIFFSFGQSVINTRTTKGIQTSRVIIFPCFYMWETQKNPGYFKTLLCSSKWCFRYSALSLMFRPSTYDWLFELRDKIMTFIRHGLYYCLSTSQQTPFTIMSFLYKFNIHTHIKLDHIIFFLYGLSWTESIVLIKRLYILLFNWSWNFKINYLFFFSKLLIMNKGLES